MASGLIPHAMEERSAQSVHEYFVCGLRIRSEIPLPELASGQPVDGAPVIDIRFGDAGPALPPRAGPIFEAGTNEYRHEVPDTARYRIRNGDEIVIAPLGRSSAALMRIFLLGTGLATLCHQRSLLPLHASAIAVDGGCVAFAGPPGAGKSTLAAFFHNLGGADAFEALLANTHRAHLVEPMGRPAAHFKNCTTLLKHAGVYAASRRHGLDLLAAEAAILERHFRDDA